MLLLTGLTLLAGCGFQLRGNIDLPPELARVSVVGADRDLVDRLSDALAQRGATVTDSAAGVVTIDLRESRFTREVLTTDINGRATAYALHYRVVFGVTAGDDHRPFASRRVPLPETRLRLRPQPGIASRTGSALSENRNAAGSGAADVAAAESFIV